MKKRSGLGFFFFALMLLSANQPVRAGWVQDGTAVCDAEGEQRYVSSVPDGAGGAIVVWEDHRIARSVIYAQRIDANGDALWTLNGMTVCTSISEQECPVVASDGAGGAIVAWVDDRNGTTNTDIFAQRVDAEGNRVWLATGVPVCRAVYDQDWPCIVPDGAGGAIIGWQDYRPVDGSSDIYAQRVDGGGAVIWAENGVPVCTSDPSQHSPVAASDGAGGAFLAWNDLQGPDVAIYAQKIDASGAAQWSLNGVTFFSEMYEQWLRIVPDGSGGAIVCWTDLRGGNEDIFAQRIDVSGALAWGTNGAAVCNLGGNERQPSMIPDGAGGAIVAWTNGSIYAQRVAGNGSRLWPSTGVRMGTGTYIQKDCVLSSDGSGGAVVAWDDGEIFAQRVDGGGAVMWKEEGVLLCTASSFAYYPAIAADGSGGAVVAWEDWRRYIGEADVYALRVDAAGNTIIATLLESYAAALTGDGIKIEWRLSETDRDVSFIVLRSAADPGPFEEITSSGIAREGLSFSYTDTDWDAGATYRYRVDFCIGAERRELFRTGPIATPSLPLALHQNAPNPFNPSTVIRFYLPGRCTVSLDVYDANGRLVKRLVGGNRGKGMHSVSWDGRDVSGREVASGIYFARLRAGKEVQSRKMILVR